jgi:thiol:disulfide interchange protein DsbD
MLHVKSFMGILLIVVALYFLGNAFPVLRQWIYPGPVFWAVASGAIVVGLLLGAVHKSFENPALGARISKALGIVLTCVGSFGFISSVTIPSRSLTWEVAEPSTDLMALVARAKEKARSEGRPVFMDFTAAWCTACKEIENKTFPDERVQRAAGRFVALKMDMTDDSDPAVQAAFKEYGVVGLPTLLLFDSEGREVKRFYGTFVTAETLASAMQSVN